MICNLRGYDNPIIPLDNDGIAEKNIFCKSNRGGKSSFPSCQKVSHEKKNDCLIGILIMIYCIPYISGKFFSLSLIYPKEQPGLFDCSSQSDKMSALPSLKFYLAQQFLTKIPKTSCCKGQVVERVKAK